MHGFLKNEWRRVFSQKRDSRGLLGGTGLIGREVANWHRVLWSDRRQDYLNWRKIFEMMQQMAKELPSRESFISIDMKEFDFQNDAIMRCWNQTFLVNRNYVWISIVLFRLFSVTSTPNWIISSEKISYGSLSSLHFPSRWLFTNVPLELFVSCKKN